MQVTKITLSPEELSVVNDTDFFHLKHDAMQKILELFGELEATLKTDELFKAVHYESLEKKTGRIFRGENYRKLPYMVLDYPKLFSADNMLTYRCMFWWGNEFSFTLHLQGRAWEKYRPLIEKNVFSLLNQEVYFCVHQSPWQYYFAEDNYLLLDKLVKEPVTFDTMLAQREFIKFSRKIPVADYKNAINYGMETFRLFFGLLL